MLLNSVPHEMNIGDPVIQYGSVHGNPPIYDTTRGLTTPEIEAMEIGAVVYFDPSASSKAPSLDAVITNVLNSLNSGECPQGLVAVITSYWKIPNGSVGKPVCQDPKTGEIYDFNGNPLNKQGEPVPNGKKWEYKPTPSNITTPIGGSSTTEPKGNPLGSGCGTVAGYIGIIFLGIITPVYLWYDLKLKKRK